MSPRPPHLRRAALASTVAAGVALLGLSVSGMAAMDADLRAAARQSAPTRLIEEATPALPDSARPCHRRPPPAAPPEPEV